MGGAASRLGRRGKRAEPRTPPSPPPAPFFSPEVLSNLQIWLAPLLRDGGPLPGAPPARAAAGSSAAAASVELPPPCRGARAFRAVNNPPTCAGPGLNILIAGGRCEVDRDGDGRVTCVGPAVTATAVPPRCAAATGGTVVVDAHCGAPGDPMFGGAEGALASRADWGAPVASAAGLAAGLAAALAPARAASAASVMEGG